MTATKDEGRGSVRVTHVITGLDVGGAEMVLLQLLTCTPAVAERHDVVSLTDAGAIAERIGALGVPVRSLGFSGNPIAAVSAFLRLWRHLRRTKPDAVQTWMYHADLLGGLAARLAGIEAVAWGLHNGSLPPPGTKRVMKVALRMSAALSYIVPRAVVCCSETSRAVHVSIGYDRRRMLVIENGFVAPERTNAARRAAARKALGLDPDVEVVGRVARFHPQKDYATMVRAAALVLEHRPGVQFLFVGKDVAWTNAELQAEIESAGIRESVHLLGERDDIGALYSAMDVAVSSSVFGEGMPLVIGEAMAQGVPVVSTDVGDVLDLVGDRSRVVPPGDPAALASAVTDLLATDQETRAKIGEEGRVRLQARFGADLMAARYDALFRDLTRTPSST